MSVRLAVAALVLVGVVLAAGAAVWLAGALFFVTSGENPVGRTGFGTWWAYWQAYGPDGAVRPRLALSALYAALIAFAPLVAVGVGISKLRPRRSLHGDARFATAREMRRVGLLGKSDEPGIVIGKAGPDYLMQREGLSAILTAPTGSGKGVGIAIPNALAYPESIVALDVKGELFDLTSAYRAEHGQEVYRFAPFDETGRTHQWNPFDGLPADERVRVAEVVSIAFTFYPDARDASDIWQPTARNLFTGLALYVLETPSAPSTIGEVLRQGSGKGQALRDHIEHARPREELPPAHRRCERPRRGRDRTPSARRMGRAGRADALEPLRRRARDLPLGEGQHVALDRNDIRRAPDALALTDRRCRDL